jgi:hypothetical protein
MAALEINLAKPSGQNCKADRQTCADDPGNHPIKQLN